MGERYLVKSELDDKVNDLRDVVLTEADLSHSFIVADFRGADLRGVNFSHCNVKTCDFRKADLRDANFSGAALESTLFEGAKLEGANFTGASCYSRIFKKGEQPDW